jgi:RHS repeat-associated protein
MHLFKLSYLCKLMMVLIICTSILRTTAQTNITLQPYSGAGFDATIYRKDASDTYGGVNYGASATFLDARMTSGVPYSARGLITFNLSAVPVGADITSATLTLYGNAHYNVVYSNASWLRRVINSWDENTVTYNNKPGYTTVGQVALANSTSNTQNYALDVTSHVQDMVNNPAANFGWILMLQDTSTYYRSLNFYSSDNASQAVCPKLDITYEMRNSVYEETYDGNGNVVAAEKKYSDQLGRPTQTLLKNLTENLVIASETEYDVYGRPVITTLPAATDARMGYRNNFVIASSAQYNYTNYETYSSTNKLNSPDAIDNSTSGTLGYYYSNNNSMESFVATTSYPYMRTEYTADPISNPVRTAIAGDEFKMGSGHESRSYSMVSGDELKFIFGNNGSSVPYLYKSTVSGTDHLGNTPIALAGGIQAAKTISMDADGKEMITYSVGKQTIATCQTGLSTSCTMGSVTNWMLYNGTASTDFHLPGNKKTSVVLPQPLYNGSSTTPRGDVLYKVTDVKTNKVLTEGYDYSINYTTRVVTFLTDPYFPTNTKSCILRVSFTYRQTFLDSCKSHSWSIGDVKVQYDLDYAKWSVNYYDLAGHLRGAVSVNGINCSSAGTVSMISTYDYSSLGQLIATKTPDEGMTEYNYDTEGKLRFSQNARQRGISTKPFNYVAYDLRGRVVETGQYTVPVSGGVWFQNYYGSYTGTGTASTNSTIINSLNGLASGQCGYQAYSWYDKTPTAEAVNGSYSYVSQYAQSYSMGRVVKTRNANMATWYSYDQMGHTTFMLQQFLDFDYTTYQTTLNRQFKAIDYTYDLNTGLLTTKTFEKNYNKEKLTHKFYYDADMRLNHVDIGRDTSVGTTPVTHITYYYYKHGPLKRKEYKDKIQGVDYVYNVNGELKSINHPALDSIKDPGQDGKSGGNGFGTDLFGMAIDYHNTDYSRSGSNIISSSGTGSNDGFYNGRIHALRWKTKNNSNSITNGGDYIDYAGTNQTRVTNGTAEELMYRYTYDDQYRLSTGIFYKFNNSTSVTSNGGGSADNYKEWGASSSGGIGYDGNGNITSLKRNAYSGTFGLNMDDFTYSYTGNTNQLSSIIDAVGANSYNDIEATTSKTFSYDNSGRLTASQAESVTATTYTPYSKLESVTFSSLNSATYLYNDKNIKHESYYLTHTGSKYKYDWFLTDENGQIMAMYEYDQNAGTPAFKIIEEHLFGIEHLGVLTMASGEIDYEITDHLGNVRVTFKDVSTGVAQLVTRSDYYSFGGAIPGRSYNLNTYRFGYQGQEAANGQLWNNFELRMHNPDLGRWISPDPYGQFSSPYLSMANNPMIFIDPDGGYTSSGSGGSSEGPGFNKRHYRPGWQMFWIAVSRFMDGFGGGGGGGGGGGDGDGGDDSGGPSGGISPFQTGLIGGFDGGSGGGNGSGSGSGGGGGGYGGNGYGGSGDSYHDAIYSAIMSWVYDFEHGISRHKATAPDPAPNYDGVVWGKYNGGSSRSVSGSNKSFTTPEGGDNGSFDNPKGPRGFFNLGLFTLRVGGYSLRAKFANTGSGPRKIGATLNGNYSFGLRYGNLVLIDGHVGRPKLKSYDSAFPGRNGSPTKGIDFFYKVSRNNSTYNTGESPFNDLPHTPLYNRMHFVPCIGNDFYFDFSNFNPD